MSEMGVRVYADGRSSNRLHIEMAARIKDVVAVAPHVRLADKGRSKPDSSSTAGVISHLVVWEYVPADDWGGLAKNDISQRDIFSEVSNYFVL